MEQNCRENSGAARPPATGDARRPGRTRAARHPARPTGDLARVRRAPRPVKRLDRVRHAARGAVLAPGPTSCSHLVEHGRVLLASPPQLHQREESPPPSAATSLVTRSTHRRRGERRAGAPARATRRPATVEWPGSVRVRSAQLWTTLWTRAGPCLRRGPGPVTPPDSGDVIRSTPGGDRQWSTNHESSTRSGRTSSPS